jgi:hypothetical protein
VRTECHLRQLPVGSCANRSISHLDEEIADIAALMPAGRPMHVGVYFAGTGCGDPPLQYDQEALTLALEHPSVSGTTVYTTRWPGASSCLVDYTKDCVIRDLYGTH